MGLTVAGYGSLIATLFAVTGTTHRRMGGSAEEWTSSELRKLGSSWRVFDRVEFRKHDVDHVAVGSDKVLVVETKWSSLELDPQRPDRILSGWVADAQDGARRIELMAQIELPVAPVLVVWGSNIERLPHGWTRVDGVVVVVGHQMRQWRRLARAGEGPPDAAAVEAISAYMARFRPASSRSAGKQRTGGHVLRLLGDPTRDPPRRTQE